MIKRGNGFEVSLTSTVETDLRLSTLCCPVAVYKGRRFQFVLVAKKRNEVVFNLIIWKFLIEKIYICKQYYNDKSKGRLCAVRTLPR